jgi:hypothetical protein
MLEFPGARGLIWVKASRERPNIPADFDLTSSLHGDVLVVTFMGASNEANAKAMARRYFEIVLGSGCSKVLADLRQLRGRLSVPGTYFLLRDLPVERVPTRIKTAIVEAPENREYAGFLETTAANAGVYFRCFLDYGEALDWLASPEPRA